MKRFRQLGETPISSALLAETVFELHAARMLLLLKHCGVRSRIDGLTKVAKLDFFVRYPAFFRKAALAQGETVETPTGSSTDSSIVRYKYGPWDNRYYHVLAYLESTGLVSIERVGRLYRITLTPKGAALAETIGEDPSYGALIQHMKDVKRTMGSKAGTTLKQLIYRHFESEVGQRPLGEVIE